MTYKKSQIFYALRPDISDAPASDALGVDGHNHILFDIGPCAYELRIRAIRLGAGA